MSCPLYISPTCVTRSHARMAVQTSARPPASLPSRPPTLHISWPQVDQLIRILHHKLPSSKRPDVLLSITRGGVIPAALLSQCLSLRNLLSATVMFYTDDGLPFYGLTEPRFLSFPPMCALEGRRVLVVDDVWDTGRTARAVRDRAKRAGAREVQVACLHWKPKGDEAPDYWGQEVDGKWIVYPWEKLAPGGVAAREMQR